MHQQKTAHLSRFQRPICPGFGTGTKGSLLMPKTFCPGWATNRDRRSTTWPLWLALAGGPVVPVGEVNRDMSGFFFEKVGLGDFAGLIQGFHILFQLANKERCVLSYRHLGTRLHLIYIYIMIIINIQHTKVSIINIQHIKHNSFS